jgi:hypothetical protein
MQRLLILWLMAQGPTPESAAPIFPGGGYVSYNSILGARESRPHEGVFAFAAGLRRDLQVFAQVPLTTSNSTGKQLQKKYASRGVVVVGISTDEKASIAAKFARQLKITYPLLIDSILMTSESEQKKFGFLGLPTTFIVDRNGIVRKKVIGFTYQEDLESALNVILR